MHQCKICLKEYQRGSALYKHERKKHGRMVRAKVLCQLCNQEFQSKAKLKMHIKGHKENRKKRLLCPIIDCQDGFVNYSTLHKHLSNDHLINLTQESYEFNEEKEFEEWKKKIEENLNATYVRDTGIKHLKGDVDKYYYVCHRSYSARLKEDHVRNIKSSGSNKINRACPSILTATKSENKVSAIFYPVHVGHECEIGRINLSMDERNKIAGKLAEGVTVTRVLQDVRESATNENFRRIHLLEKRDIHNIKRDFSIGYATKRHNNDAVSVKLWVEHMRNQENNTVLFYKEQGQSNDSFKTEDFILIIMTEFQKQQISKFGNQKICIDGTHGLNSYDFQLYTLMVVDEFGSGMPVAFCFSNRADVKLFVLYFTCIKEAVGTISASVFMSDDAPAFYNAWERTMGPVNNQLLCSWHVNRNWVQNLNKIINTEKRTLVFKTLQVLQKEFDIEKFYFKIDTFIKELKNDEDTKPFGQYFVQHYANRVEKWAYCFRKYLGINTNMYLESLHKTIKHCYLEGKQCKRLDKTINVLLNVVRDKMFERLIKLTKQKTTEKIRKIKKSHERSNLITPEMISESSENTWLVYSATDATHQYLVEKIKENCDRSCALQCTSCSICVHAFKCSCSDNIINLNICKHIHACAYTKGFKQPSSNKGDFEIKDTLHCVNTTNEGISNRQEIQQKLELLLGLNSRTVLCDESYASMSKGLDKFIDQMNQGQVEFVERNNHNVQKQVEPQIRFNSTKKKIAEKTKMQGPSLFETTVISDGLLHEDKTLNVHSTFDHSYCSDN